MQDYAQFFMGANRLHEVEVDLPGTHRQPETGESLDWPAASPLALGCMELDGHAGWLGHQHVTAISKLLPRSALIETCWQFDGIRASARTKPWWLPIHRWPVWNGLGDALRTDAECSCGVAGAWLWAEGALFWQWRPEILGRSLPISA